MWTIFTKPGIPPFRLMDRVHLDVILNIDEHYASVPGLPEEPRQLLHEYIDKGRLGVKSGRGLLRRLLGLSVSLLQRAARDLLDRDRPLAAGSKQRPVWRPRCTTRVAGSE
jgi:3-hydroxyacyl-CoA dehydrogenase